MVGPRVAGKMVVEGHGRGPGGDGVGPQVLPEGEVLAEEARQLLLPEGDRWQEGVDEAGAGPAGHLPLPLAQLRGRVEEVAGGAAEGPHGGESPWQQLATHPELAAAASQGVVAGLGAGVGGGRGHCVLRAGGQVTG